MNITGPTIALRSGCYFSFASPQHSDFTIEDIAHGLSHICRFAGQTVKFYSVAEHCVHVSNIIGEGDQYVGLMHDAPEAFIGDVVKPLKNLLPDYQTIEDRVEAAVMERFSVPLPFPQTVKIADVEMLRCEKLQAMNNQDNWQDQVTSKIADIKLQFWSPKEAKQAFLERFNELKEGSNQ